MNEPDRNLDTNAPGELSVLREIDDVAASTQRGLSSRLGISLGLANLLVKRVINKGYVTVSRSGWRRRLYYLTPAGAVQKVSLTKAYVGRFLDEYHQIKIILQRELSDASLNRESRVALYGTDRLAELVYLVIKDLGVDSIDVFRAGGLDREFLGMEVHDLAALPVDDYERVVIADLADAEVVSETLSEMGMPARQIVRLFAQPTPSAPPADYVEEAVVEQASELS